MLYAHDLAFRKLSLDLLAYLGRNQLGGHLTLGHLTLGKRAVLGELELNPTLQLDLILYATFLTLASGNTSQTTLRAFAGSFSILIPTSSAMTGTDTPKAMTDAMTHAKTLLRNLIIIKSL